MYSKASTPRHHMMLRKAKMTYTNQLWDQHDGKEIYSGPLKMDVTFYVASVPSVLQETPHHVYRPSLNDLQKYLEKVIEGILILDHCIITSITSRKVYDKDNPRTEFTITEL
jgi:Holliday junction resolvase RusA-like endonuclease